MNPTFKSIIYLIIASIACCILGEIIAYYLKAIFQSQSQWFYYLSAWLLIVSTQFAAEPIAKRLQKKP